MEIYNNSDNHIINTHTSKGNQIKFRAEEKWYKVDNFGYEGASEFLASELLYDSNVPDFVSYEIEDIYYNGVSFKGCVSEHFLKEGEQIVTIAHVFKQNLEHDISFYFRNASVKDKIKMTVNIIENETGVPEFGEYLTMLLEIDTMFYNEDRHFNNIALIQKDDQYWPSPVFDNGAAFFSDTKQSFPLYLDDGECFDKITAKPFSTNFEKQMTAARELYGNQFILYFDEVHFKHAITHIRQEYGDDIAARVEHAARHQIYRNPAMVQEHKRPAPRL